MKTQLICRGFIAYGPAIVGCLYLTWIVGRFSLGHWPRPSLDDPKDIAWIGPFYWVTMSLVWLWPAAVSGAGFAVALAWRAEDPQRKQRLLEMLLGVMVLFGCFWFLRSDPLQVASWFAD